MKSAEEWPYTELGKALLMKGPSPAAHLVERSLQPTLPRIKEVQ